MATAIPPEAIERFRRLETRAAAAGALADTVRERLDRYRDEEKDLRVSMAGFFCKAATGGSIVVGDDGGVEHHLGDGRVRVLAEKNPTAARLKRIEARIAETAAERDRLAAEAAPIRGLVAACREHLKSAGWDGL